MQLTIILFKFSIDYSLSQLAFFVQLFFKWRVLAQFEALSFERWGNWVKPIYFNQDFDTIISPNNCKTLFES